MSNRTMCVASPMLSLILSGLDNLTETALVDAARACLTDLTTRI